MPGALVDRHFWQDRTVLVTGHSGFKGSWLVLWLRALGARVAGVSAGVPGAPSLYELARAGEGVDEIAADVRDRAAVLAALRSVSPEIVVHLAAQPLVRRSYADPHGTFETNVMGTVNVLEAVRATPSVRVLLAVTTDKCYANAAGRPRRPFVEDDPIGGDDPYSASKGCAELVIDAYRRSFFEPGGDGDGPRVGSARAGNVVGGGDWGADRLIPDIIRDALAGVPARVRNPDAVRPWQHVLNPLSGYLRLAQLLHAGTAPQGGWNFGPPADDVRPVRWIVERLAEQWPGKLRWDADPGPHPPEAQFLALDSTKAREQLGWAPRWDLARALAEIVAWYAALRAGKDMRQVTLEQIESFAAAGLTAA
jgi:CDP-glucose 4,6-dehydratase